MFKKYGYILGILFGLLVISGCSKGQDISVYTETDPVDIIYSIDAFGYIKAANSKNIILDFPATIEIIHIKEGDKVEKGDTLITLDITEFKAQIASESHELNIAKTALSKINPGEVNRFKRDLKYGENNLNRAKDDLETNKLLYESGVISKSELDQWMDAVDEKARQVAELELNLSNIQKEIILQHSRIELMEQNLEITKGKLLRSYMNGNQIVSDIETGAVYDLFYSVGDRVNPSIKVLSIMDTSYLVVEAEIVEDFIRDVSLDSKVTIVPLADKTREYTGMVTKIAYKAFRKNGEMIVPVEITIDDADDFLMPNFNVDVTIYQ